MADVVDDGPVVIDLLAGPVDVVAEICESVVVGGAGVIDSADTTFGLVELLGEFMTPDLQRVDLVAGEFTNGRPLRMLSNRRS